jgi:hypothetical protein
MICSCLRNAAVATCDNKKGRITTLLHFYLDITFGFTATGQNFSVLNECQWLSQPVNLAGNQPTSTGTAIAFTTLKLDRHVV